MINDKIVVQYGTIIDVEEIVFLNIEEGLDEQGKSTIYILFKNGKDAFIKFKDEKTATEFARMVFKSKAGVK